MVTVLCHRRLRESRRTFKIEMKRAKFEYKLFANLCAQCYSGGKRLDGETSGSKKKGVMHAQWTEIDFCLTTEVFA